MTYTVGPRQQRAMQFRGIRRDSATISLAASAAGRLRADGAKRYVRIDSTAGARSEHRLTEGAHRSQVVGCADSITPELVPA